MKPLNAPKVLCTAAALVALFGAACKAEHDAATRPAAARAPDVGKPQAPVDVTAIIDGESARVTIAFQTDATGVDVEVRGVDGLAVTSAARPIANASYAAGSRETFTVALSPPDGQSNLVVEVSGTFAEVPGSKVASFTVGYAAGGHEAGAVKTSPSGERIKELPGERR